MKNRKKISRIESFAKPCSYQLKLKGKVTPTLLMVVDDLQVRPDPDNNMINLFGWLPDQSALLGILNALHDIHYPILSVHVMTKIDEQMNQQ